MPRFWRILCIVALFAAPAAAAPAVVASIKPVHALVAGVMAGVGTPALLVAGSASVHSYSLRPSDAARLDRAAVVFWVGPALERFLERPLATLGAKAEVVALMAAPGVRVLPAREGGLWERHDDEPDRVAADHDTTDQGAAERDGHIWLDPGNAKAMVAAIARTLSTADPANAAHYAANAAAVATRIDALDGELAARLAPVKGRPFVVFHDAYQYFERHYGLNAVGSITVAADRPPGARRVTEIKAKIAAHGAVCVFAEPQFQPRLVTALIAGTGARMGSLDPEGSSLDPGPDLYDRLMRGLADGLAGCLGG